MGKNIAIAALGYLVIGVGVTYWTITRQKEDKPAFDGIGSDPNPANIMLHAIGLWPYAVYVNLTKAK